MYYVKLISNELSISVEIAQQVFENMCIDGFGSWSNAPRERILREASVTLGSM